MRLLAIFPLLLLPLCLLVLCPVVHAQESEGPDEAEPGKMDLIMQGSDDLMVELDIAWVQVGGQIPFRWIEKYKDRILSAHIKDIAPSGERQDEDGWADVGYGVMDWPGLFRALDQTTVEYFVMEHDNPSDDTRFAKRSIDTCKGLEVPA